MYPITDKVTAAAPTLPSWVSDYIGKPFVDLARGPDAYDCWGLVRHVLTYRYGIADLPHYGEYESTRDPRIPGIIDTVRRGWELVSQPAPADVVLIRVLGKPRHVGALVAPGRMLHADRGTGVCVEYLDSDRWLGRIEGYYRHVA